MTRSRRPPILTRAGTGYVRATDSIRTNTPDGWVSNQDGPVWWIGSDRLEDYSLTDYGLTPWHGGWGPTVWGDQPYRQPYTGVGTRGVLPAVTRATNIVVGPVIRTTWRYSRGTATDVSDVSDGTEQLNRPLWIADPQLVGRIPGGELDRSTVPYSRRLGAHDFWKTALTHALWFGIGAIMFVEDSFRQPLAGTLQIVNPGCWGWTSDGNRIVLHPDTDDPVEFDEDGYMLDGGILWRIVLIRGYSPNDGQTPEGALTRSGLLLSTGMKMNSYLGGIMSSGVPSGVLKVGVPNFGEPDAAALKDSWMKAHGGTNKSVAVLNSGVDFTPLQLNVIDSDVVNAKGSWLVDLAHAFNISAVYLDAATGVASNITYANLTDRRRDLLDLTLSDWGRTMEDLITALLPYGQKMRVDWSGFLNTDPSNDLQFVKQGLEMGYLTEDEARDRLGLPPRTDIPAPQEVPA